MGVFGTVVEDASSGGRVGLLQLASTTTHRLVNPSFPYNWGS